MTQQAGTTSRARLAHRRALRDEVFDVVMEKIAGGEVAADEPLGIDQLASELGVSPTPVREALVQLEATGLVIRTALRGYRVAPPLSRDAMEELFYARRVVEVGAARRAVSYATQLLPILRRRQDFHEEHAQILANSGGEVEPGALRAYLAADWGFHQAIFDGAGNRFLLEMAKHISTHGHRLRQFVDTQHLDVEQAVAEHQAVLQAFQDGDVEAVGAAMGQHIDAVRERTVNDYPS